MSNHVIENIELFFLIGWKFIQKLILFDIYLIIKALAEWGDWHDEYNEICQLEQFEHLYW